jgi:hypothetical protein
MTLIDKLREIGKMLLRLPSDLKDAITDKKAFWSTKKSKED